MTLKNIILKRCLAFYIDAFISLILTSLVFILIYLIDDSIDLSKLNIPITLYQLIIMLLYFFISEYFFGKTLAKKILKLKVVYSSKTKNKMLNIFLRTIFRLIPLDIFSIFFNVDALMWYDMLSRTKVIEEKNDRIKIPARKSPLTLH